MADGDMAEIPFEPSLEGWKLMKGTEYVSASLSFEPSLEGWKHGKV